jgi:hypothetical protein
VAAAKKQQADAPSPVAIAPRPAQSLVPGRLYNDSYQDEVDEQTQAELDSIAKYGEEDRSKPDPMRDAKVPVVLLGAGFLLLCTRIALLSAHGSFGLTAVVFGVGFEVIVNVILMLVGVLLAAKVTGIYFGELPQALLKLCAIYVGPTALGTTITAMLGGDIAVASLGWATSVVLYYILTSYLFRLDGSQTVACVTAIGVTRLAAAILFGILAIGALSAVSNHSTSQDEDPRASTGELEP